MDGKKVIRHGGAVYGFATEFAALPDDKLGVIVCASKDVANAVTARIANAALKHMLAKKAGKALPKLENSTALDLQILRPLVDRYILGDKQLDIVERNGKAWI